MHAKDTIRARISERVSALGKSPITLAKSVGLERGYINDILRDKKRSVHANKLAAVAEALECDVDYLTGKQEDVRRKIDMPGMEFAGVCETGVWRTEAAAEIIVPRGGVPIDDDVRYPGLRNLAFDVRGDGMAGEGVSDGMTVAGIAAADWLRAIGPLRTGMIVAVRAERGDPIEFELSLRRLQIGPDQTLLVARPSNPRRSFPPLTLAEGVEIVAVVTRAIRLFLDLE